MIYVKRLTIMWSITQNRYFKYWPLSENVPSRDIFNNVMLFFFFFSFLRNTIRRLSIVIRCDVRCSRALCFRYEKVLISRRSASGTVSWSWPFASDYVGSSIRIPICAMRGTMPLSLHGENVNASQSIFDKIQFINLIWIFKLIQS